MSTVIAILCLFVGAFFGVLAMALLQINRRDDVDTELLDATTAFGWHIGNNAGQWAVMRPVNGVLTVIGVPHKSPREALAAALKDEHGRG